MGKEEASLAVLTVRTSMANSSGKDLQTNALDSSRSIKNSLSPSPYDSPSLVSPPSSAFVSALQSPYISPRATVHNPQDTFTAPPVLAYKGSECEDIPSSSYTPPSDEFSDDPFDRKFKFSACTSDPTPPRISFSFPVPRVSFAKVSVSSPTTNAKLRSCDVFIGFNGQNPNLVRFCKWVKSELELQGIACFVADRAKYSDTQSHEIADRVICSVTYGIVVMSCSSLLNYFSLEEVRFFAQKKNLIPIFYGTEPTEIMNLLNCNSIDKECREAIDGLMKCHEFKLEANESNWRSCVAKTTEILQTKLGRKSMADKKVMEGFDELPFPRNRYFLGREKEIMEIETAFFGNGEYFESTTPSFKGEASSQSESDKGSTMNGKYISLDLGKCSEATSEAYSDPNESIIGRNSLKKLLKGKKYRNSNCKGMNRTSIICVNGVPGIGKTELALEFAYRYSQRYKRVLWIGGEARYLRQNLLNLSLNLGLDVSADAEKDRGRLRSFDEQEIEAFKRIKRELFRDMPYLLIIDNLEIEKDWWEGKDLHDLIPKNTGGTHVLITTRLPKVMNFDMIQLLPLPLSDSMVLLRGRRKKDYPIEEIEILKKFDEKLGRLSYGLWLIGSLLSELSIPPSALFEAVTKVQIEERSASPNDEQFCKSNPFITKILTFCAAILDQAEGNRNLLSLKMLLVGAWFAPEPVSVNLLTAAAKNMPAGGNRLSVWSKCLSHTFTWCSRCGLGQQSEEDSALLLVRLGLARTTNRQSGTWIQFHPITQAFARRRDSVIAPKATVQGVRKIGNPLMNLDHLWASAFLVFGFKSEAPLVLLKAMDMVIYIKKTALPLAITAFTTFSRCNSALELLKVCTNVLEEVEKSFVNQIQDWRHGTFCWKKSNRKVDEYVWQDVTLLKATLLETRAKLLLRGGHFDSGEELCRTCISIRTVMLGHNHSLTLAAQDTLAKLVRMRSKI